MVRPVTAVSSIQDTNILKLKDYFKKNQLPYNGIPNAIITKPLPPVYLGNNGMGSDIYASGIDHMPMLMPDSDFASKMPVARLTDENKTNMPPAYTLPGNRLKELIEKQKNRDSFFRKPVQPRIYRYPKK